jgi:trehalose-6-phosphate synthase
LYELAGRAVGAGRVVLRVDQLSRRILRRLEAYERFLERYPRWHRGISLVQVVLPSPADGSLRELVERLVGRINGLFGEIDWVPVHYLYRSSAGSLVAGDAAPAAFSDGCASRAS